ncbi:MBL fold metallo-hydrolase [Alkalimarinus alittae]|uniref:MBL fold metallo-hydrolase n=1 Tax=Alkalimarinus alittae TaxID=2961619 RepID=A0ABY6MXF7_9ALTE|nr:MBL fold metallo-hydrolase [Alkalimarinus alittae]UZE94513.1 MBL fold metallo-hydrolase [Alkalimarinus alittae]
MNIQFLGAAGTVTGSRYLVRHNGTTLLIDCGLFQGVKALRNRNWTRFPFPPVEIDAVVLTHAHLDHIGYLPRLVNEGFKGSIYCTEATKALAEILLKDSAHIQEEDARRANKYGYSKHTPAEPLYTINDAKKTIAQFKTVSFSQPLTINEGAITFYPAGHILGSAFIKLQLGECSVVFSGDVGRPNDLTMKPPHQLVPSDYLVVESTYGDRLHASNDPVSELQTVILQTAKKGGTLMVPAFSVGRVQGLSYAISELKEKGLIPDIPVYLDSPMGIDVTKLYCDFNSEHRLSKEQCHRMCKGITFVKTPQESEKLTMNPHPKIIIAGAGMLNGGRILHHLIAFGGNHRNTLLVTGYQANGTRGRALLDGAKQIKAYGKYTNITCGVRQISGLSAHADYNELVEWLQSSENSPTKVIITHGEPAASDNLRRVLTETLSLNAVIPEMGETIELR